MFVQTQLIVNDSNSSIYDKSLMDMGVINNTYNDKKTFFKRKQAEAYIKLHSRK